MFSSIIHEELLCNSSTHYQNLLSHLLLLYAHHVVRTIARVILRQQSPPREFIIQKSHQFDGVCETELCKSFIKSFGGGRQSLSTPSSLRQKEFLFDLLCRSLFQPNESPFGLFGEELIDQVSHLGLEIKFFVCSSFLLLRSAGLVAVANLLKHHNAMVCSTKSTVYSIFL